MHILKTQLVSMYHQLYFLPPLSCFHAHLLALSHVYIYIYILGKVKTHTCVRADTHNILYACTSPELHTYKYGDISSKTVVILPYFVHMHVSFQAKEVDAPKGEEQVFFKTQQGQH